MKNLKKIIKSWKLYFKVLKTIFYELMKSLDKQKFKIYYKNKKSLSSKNQKSCMSKYYCLIKHEFLLHPIKMILIECRIY